MRKASPLRFTAPCALLLALGLAGCSEQVVLDGAGIACLSPTPGWPDVGQRFEADALLYATVRLHTCLSSSCDTERHASCSVSLTGDQLVIEAEGGYTEEGGAGSCTEDCVILEAQCQTAGVIPAGDYGVSYGDARIELTLPSTTGVHCLPPNSR